MALLLEAFESSGRTAPDIEWALSHSAIDLGDVGPDNDHGMGLINIPLAREMLLADISRNRQIDFADIAVLALYWLQTCTDPCDTCQTSNLTSDVRIDLSDFALLSNHWHR